MLIDQFTTALAKRAHMLRTYKRACSVLPSTSRTHLVSGTMAGDGAEWLE